jgi:hypothetical protein
MFMTFCRSPGRGPKAKRFKAWRARCSSVSLEAGVPGRLTELARAEFVATFGGGGADAGCCEKLGLAKKIARRERIHIPFINVAFPRDAFFQF